MTDDATPIKTYAATEFAWRLKHLAQQNDINFTFFLGAGCSVSSGIPSAATLTRKWVEALHEPHQKGHSDPHKWAATRFEGYTWDNAGAYYFDVIEDLYNTEPSRQEAIEDIIASADLPRFGYAELAQLMAHDTFGAKFSTVLTTNFDDMVADALYLYTRKKPRVIAHESLAGFARVRSSRPLVFKVHGDARLSPKNTMSETRALEKEVQDKLLSLLNDTALVFIGYGGNDESIATLIEALPPGKPAWGIYWVGGDLPDTRLGHHLRTRESVFHVNHFDFDELMAHIKAVFETGEPIGLPHAEMMETYREDLGRLQQSVAAKSDRNEKAGLGDALGKIAKSDKSLNWLGVTLEAERHKMTDPQKADAIYQEGLRDIGEDARLLNNYAVFLENHRGDLDGAAAHYKRALEADPKNAANLGNYVEFLALQERDDEAATSLQDMETGDLDKDKRLCA
ncbi:MAG: SIR2 family protein, partial [Alphaproteobacteria bacterium]|nr:SIR2 family protein [Alphaproteobacteria bacterium]